MHSQPSTKNEEDDGTKEEGTNGDTNDDTFINTRVATILQDDNGVATSRGTSWIGCAAIRTFPEVVTETDTSFTIANSIAVTVVGARR